MTSTPTPTQGLHDRPRSKAAPWIRGGVVLVCVLLVGVPVLLFVWMVEETRFAQPSAEFDELTDDLEALPGVSVTMSDRWVEVPVLSSPRSWVQLTTQEDALPGLLEAACAADYADPVTWSMTVRTDAGSEVSLHTEGDDPRSVDACPDFGFDALSVVDEIDAVAPGLSVQPAIWPNDTFALVSLDGWDAGPAADFTDLLPLVAHSHAIARAGGLSPEQPVQINATTLDIRIGAGESDRYVAMLTELYERHGVRSFWADGAGTPTDGIEKVQIVAPGGDEGAIERVVRASGLRIADLPVRFIEQ